MVTTISHENQYMIYVREQEGKAHYGYKKEIERPVRKQHKPPDLSSVEAFCTSFVT
jgi:hypothetical protein